MRTANGAKVIRKKRHALQSLEVGKTNS
jgi:hypothetical protein